jgi:hypothetical protein
VFVLADSGALIVVGVVLIIVAAAAYGMFSLRDGDIDAHPLGGERGDGAPGAEGPSEATGQDAGASSAFDQHGTR